MRINFKEYENMVVRLNWQKNKWVFIGGGIIVLIGCFLLNYLTGEGLLFSIITSLIGAIAYYFLLNYIIKNSAKKINSTSKLIYIEQEIRDDKIIEKAVNEDNTESYGEYNYTDVLKVKEDKYNYYLYMSANAAIIVNKEKLDDINKFKQIIDNINKNNLEKSI